MPGVGRRARQREPEVRDADPAVGADEDVLRLEVAVHEPGAVRRLKALAGRGEHVADSAASSAFDLR
ncbi:MAG: hypothetical protein QM765_53615 [Myxococcales bacterium]